jgi:hypothetical protein
MSLIIQKELRKFMRLVMVKNFADKAKDVSLGFGFLACHSVCVIETIWMAG